MKTHKPDPSKLWTPHATIACDGTRAPLKTKVDQDWAPSLSMGHPKVYLTYNKDGCVTCPYCGAKFCEKKHTAKHL